MQCEASRAFQVFLKICISFMIKIRLLTYVLRKIRLFAPFTGKCSYLFIYLFSNLLWHGGRGAKDMDGTSAISSWTISARQNDIACSKTNRRRWRRRRYWPSPWYKRRPFVPRRGSLYHRRILTLRFIFLVLIFTGCDAASVVSCEDFFRILF